MKKLILLFLASLIVLGFYLNFLFSATKLDLKLPQVEAYCPSSNQWVFESINRQRVFNQLPPLQLNEVLTQSAYIKAQDINEKGYWSHVSPTGQRFWQIIYQAGYPYTYVGENLARDFACDNQAIAAWMASPTHRANILNDDFINLGVARYNNVIVTHFGGEK